MAFVEKLGARFLFNFKLEIYWQQQTHKRRRKIHTTLFRINRYKHRSLFSPPIVHTSSALPAAAVKVETASKGREIYYFASGDEIEIPGDFYDKDYHLLCLCSLLVDFSILPYFFLAPFPYTSAQNFILSVVFTYRSTIDFSHVFSCSRQKPAKFLFIFIEKRSLAMRMWKQKRKKHPEWNA